MAESTNVLPITDSIMYYLTKDEFASAEKLTFKNFGKIYETDMFRVHVLLRIGSKTGRDYTFIIRTFGKQSSIIDSHKLAEWNDQDQIFCYGSIDEKLIITKSCKNSSKKDFYQITNDGKIISTSYHSTN